MSLGTKVEFIRIVRYCPLSAGFATPREPSWIYTLFKCSLELDPSIFYPVGYLLISTCSFPTRTVIENIQTLRVFFDDRVDPNAIKVFKKEASLNCFPSAEGLVSPITVQ